MRSNLLCLLCLLVDFFLPGPAPVCLTYHKRSFFLDRDQTRSRLAQTMESRSRRDFLKAVIGSTAAFSLASGGFAQQSSASVAATRLSENMVLLTGAGRNVLAVTGPDGTLMVNGGRPEQSADLLKAVAAQSSSNNRVQALFNTDWYPENTGSNEALGKAGAKIIAHENTKLWLGTDINVEWQKRTYKPRPSQAIPNQTFYTTGKMTFGKGRDSVMDTSARPIPTATSTSSFQARIS